MRHITSWQRQAGSSTTWRVPASRFAMAQCQDRPGRRSVIHLDSSFLIDLLRETTRERPGGALEFIESLPDDEVLAISVHVLAELRAGAELAKQPLREHEELDRLCSGLVVSYPDDRFAPAYARLLAALQRTRRPMAAMDLLIATAATLDDAPLVTRNVKDFSRVPGVRVLRY
jgi:predicted nucleic acid-binding protein